MKRALFLLACIAAAICAFAKKKTFSQYDYFNGPAFWQRVALTHNAVPLIGPQDTAIIIATNRDYEPDSMRFLTEHSKHNRLRWFLMYASGGRWHTHEVGSLSEAKSYLPSTNKDWVVYTEGMGKIFTSDADRGMRMAGQYGINVLLMDYPSIRTDKGAMANYYFAKGNAIAAYKDFLPVLDSVRILRQADQMGSGRLSLFFHSMGNKVMKEIMQHSSAMKLNQGVWVDNIILNAPCVAMRGHRKWVEQIAFARRIYVHYNPEDMTLKWARIMSLHKQLGDKMRRPVSDAAVYINFNSLCDVSHSNFLGLYGRGLPPQASIQHYDQVLHGDSVAVHGAGYRASVYRKIGWDILPVETQ